MTIQQVHRKLGQWSIALRDDAPPGVVASLDLLGHVAVVPGRMNPVEHGDYLLSVARYVGVLRALDADTRVVLSGAGLAYWLGDENGGGAILEAPGVALAGDSFAAAVAAVLPSAGRTGAPGTIFSGVSGSITTTRVWETRRTALDWLCDTMGGEWRIRTDGLVDAGPASSLFRTTPECIVARRDLAGQDMGRRALAGEMQSSVDAKSYTTRVVVVAEGMATGSATAPSTPFKDLHGQDVELTRLLDERDGTEGGNAAARAAAALSLYGTTRRSVRLSVADFDVAGDVEPGDVIWCYDPDAGIYDEANELAFRGRLIYPAAVRALALSWPVTADYTVGFRRADGSWVDLTPWVEFEAPGGGEVEVADSLSTPLTSGIGGIGTTVPGGGGGAGDAAIPGTPTFGTFTSTSYQPDDGLSRAAVKVTWTQPLNTDSSSIVDGDHYEVRYRPTGTSDWQTQWASWDSLSTTIQGLPPSTGFDWQIRAVDYASPVNYGAWSSTTTFSTADDTTAPGVPAAPTVAASLIAVQVTHTLGLAAGGTYNLPLDLDHLEVHADTSSGFTPSAGTLLGKLPANAGMITAGIPAVGTFAVDTAVGAGVAAHVKVIAVDKTGNRSTASTAASATADLIDSAFISSLSASKITAGTISAALVLGGSITGGTLQTGTSGQRITIDSTNGGTIWFRDSSADYAFINGPSSGIGMNSGNGGGSYRTRLFLTPTAGFFQNVNSSGVQVGGGMQVSSNTATVYTTTGTVSVYSNGGPAAIFGTTAVTVNTTAGQALFSTDSGNAYLMGTTTVQVLATAGGAYIQGTSGVEASTTSGTARCSTGSGTAILGSNNNNYVSVNGSTAAVVGGGGTSFINVTSTTIDNVSTAFKANAVYNVTTGFAANVYVVSGGQMYRSTSSARAKVRIKTADVRADDVLKLRPVTYLDRRQWTELDEDDTACSPQLGLIAEEVAAVPGLGDLLVERDEQGEPMAVNYERLAVALLDVVRDLSDDVAILQGRSRRPPRPPAPVKYRDERLVERPPHIEPQIMPGGATIDDRPAPDLPGRTEREERGHGGAASGTGDPGAAEAHL